MWGKPPFFISDNCAVLVRSLQASRAWYREKLHLKDAPKRSEDDSGRPFVDLTLSGDSLITLLEAEPGSFKPSDYEPDTRPILFTRNLEKTYDWFGERGVAVGPLTSDSGGNQFFKFQDLDGNSIEVCKEP